MNSGWFDCGTQARLGLEAQLPQFMDFVRMGAIPSTTTPVPTRDETQTVQPWLCRIFADASEEHFEDGMESDFTRRLGAALAAHGDTVLSVLTSFVASHKWPNDTLAEALRLVGRVGGSATASRRRALLLTGVRDPSFVVRDGAVIGLEHLDDPETLSALQDAFTEETVRFVREGISQVIDQLRAHTINP